MPKVKVALLVKDFTIYPRHELDSVQVRRLKEALAAGNELPPILVDRASNRIVDGFHRHTAHVEHFGEDAEIAVTFKTYASEQELFMEAAALNSRHGVPMESMDQRHCILRAQALSITLDDLAVALSVPLEKLETMTRSSYATGPDGVVILKTPTGHFSGRSMTRKQVAVNDKLVGMQATYYLNRVTELLREKMLNLSDEKVVESLRRLRDALDSVPASVFGEVAA